MLDSFARLDANDFFSPAVHLVLRTPPHQHQEIGPTREYLLVSTSAVAYRSSYMQVNPTHESLHAVSEIFVNWHTLTNFILAGPAYAHIYEEQSKRIDHQVVAIPQSRGVVFEGGSLRRVGSI